MNGAAAIALTCGVSLLCACASSPVSSIRFANRPPVWRVDDRRPIPRPAVRAYSITRYFADAYLLRRLPRALEFRGQRRAMGVNSLDKVPDSTWFTNRIGRRAMSPAELRRGPCRGDGPDRHRPWIIEGTKIGGMSTGFRIRDQRGRRYLLKFGAKSDPVVETATAIIVQRLLYACGYNVPDERIVQLRPGDLVLAEDAVIKDPMGAQKPMTRRDLAESLKKVHVDGRGQMRGMISRFVPGVPIGGVAPEGVRKDDANDRIPHQLRRDLRGLNAIFAWLNRADVKEANSLDAWFPKGRYVVHYQIDFGMALGVMGRQKHSKQVGYAYTTDLQYALLTLPTFGLWVRPWERLEQPDIAEVGLFSARGYNPGHYRASFPYPPLDNSDRFDNFWGASLLMRFTPQQIRAVVEEAKLSSTRAVDHIVRTLIERQRITARYWFERVAPLDHFDVVGGKLCFTDLALLHDLTPRAGTRYVARAFDYEGRPAGAKVAAQPEPGGRACVGPLTWGRSQQGYTIVQVITRRKERRLPGVEVHVARDPSSGLPRVIGLRRR